MFIVDPAVEQPAHDSFNAMTALTDLRMTYHMPALFGVSSLLEEQSRHGCLGAIILGSAAHVTEGKSWQKELVGWLQIFSRAKKPILGICYGHQLLAHMHGAKVDYLFPDQRKLTGTRHIEFHSNSRLFPNGWKGELYVSHKQAVIDLSNTPLKATAKSPDCLVDSFEHRDLPIYGVQSHPEATPQFIRTLGQELPAGDSYRLAGSQVLRAFFGLVGQYSA